MKRTKLRTGAIAAVLFSAVATTLAAVSPETGGAGAAKLHRFLHDNPSYQAAIARSEAEFGGAADSAVLVSVNGQTLLEIGMVANDGRRKWVRYDPASGTLSTPEGHKYTVRDVVSDAVST